MVVAEGVYTHKGARVALGTGLPPIEFCCEYDRMRPLDGRRVRVVVEEVEP